MTEAKTKEVNICWLSGNYHQRRQIILKLMSYMASKGSYEYLSYDKDASFEYVSIQLRQNSIFDTSQRLVVLNDWPSFEGTKETLYRRFVKIFEGLANGVVLVCNNLETQSGKFMDVVKKVGVVYDYPTNIPTGRATGWIGGELSKRGKDISQEDAEKVSQAAGQEEGTYGVDVDKLFCIIDKLCCYIGKKKSITLPDVMAVCTESQDFIIWSMYDAMDRRDFCECIRFLHLGISNAKSLKDFAGSTTNSIIWRYKLLFLAKECTSSGRTPEAAIDSIMMLNRLSKTGSNFLTQYAIKSEDSENKPLYSKKMVDKMFDGKYRKPPVQCYNRKDLFLIIKAAIETLNKLRDSAVGFVLSDSEILVILEALLMTICGVGDETSLQGIRRLTHGKLS